MNKNGFISISVIYSFFLVILLLLALIMSTYINNRVNFGIYLDDIKKTLFLEKKYNDCMWDNDSCKCLDSENNLQEVEWSYCDNSKAYGENYYVGCHYYFITYCQEDDGAFSNPKCKYSKKDGALESGLVNYSHLNATRPLYCALGNFNSVCEVPLDNLFSNGTVCDSVYCGEMIEYTKGEIKEKYGCEDW